MEHANGEVLIFTCAGASHAGQVANQAGIDLMRQKDGNLFCLAAMSADIPEKVKRARDAGVLVAIDGCEDHCCKKTLEKAGLVADVHVVATDLGIPKKPEKPHTAEDVQNIVRKVQADMLALAN
jgi:uncharacterized metal-binding protein